MSVRLLPRFLIAVVCCTLLGPSGLLAAPPRADTLLPATTKGFVSVPDMGQLLAYFNRSQFGRLVNDPAMQPFVEDLQRQMQQKGLRQLDQIGLTWKELETVPGGEAAIAVIQTGPESASVALVVDITGRQQMAQALLDRVAARMAERGIRPMRRQAGDPIVAYQLPAEPNQGHGPTSAAYYVRDNLLIASDNVSVVENIAIASLRPRQDSLATLPAYREIMNRCRASGGNEEVLPDLVWFIEPFGYAEAARSQAPPRERRKGPDLLKVLKSQGFTAIQGVGGMVNFSAGPYEVVHRTMIYAPPLAGRDADSRDKYDLAARMLRFPASKDLAPQSWVPRDAATYSTFNWDMKNAFNSAETLVDEMVGERGVFRDVLESLKEDTDGPMVDIQRDLVGNLGTRATVISDNELPIGPRSERKVFIAEVTDEATVAKTIRRLMESDKDARLRDFNGVEIWEIVPTESEMPELTIEAPGGAIQHDQHANGGQKQERLLSTSALCVAKGHLFCASHIDLLKKVLAQAEQSNTLTAEDDYQRVAQHADSIVGGAPLAFRSFSRMDEELRPTYELIRTGQMPQSETFLGQILNSVLGEGKEGVPRQQKIDGGALPDFETVRKHLGPAGMAISSLDDGWFCIGFALPRQTTAGPTTARFESR